MILHHIISNCEFEILSDVEKQEKRIMLMYYFIFINLMYKS